MSAIPIANGGLLHRALDLPDFRNSAVAVKKLGATLGGNVPTLGNFLREVMRLNMCNFRAFGPDETQSNRLEAIYEAGRKVWLVAPGKGQLFDQFARIQLVEVWFNCAPAGCICLERVTQPEAAQAALIHQLNWPLPQQPPPRIYKADFQECVDNLRATFLARSRGKPSAPIKKMRKSG
ncbi:MAG: hypothetical protein WBW14_04220 [Candidatus Acidiferrum sp.]|jgi:hypothetical protein